MAQYMMRPVSVLASLLYVSVYISSYYVTPVSAMYLSAIALHTYVVCMYSEDTCNVQHNERVLLTYLPLCTS
jgi:hypothetical protein